MPPKKRFVTCEICGDRAKRIDREKRKFMAKFPLDESRCRQWVKFVGKEDLIYVPIEKLHSLKYVCGAHFESKAFNKKNNRLNKSAVPLINLGADPLPDEKLLEFPCHISSYTDMITMEVSKRTNLNVASTAMTEPIAGSSHMEKSTSSDLLLLEHAYCIQKEIILPETTRCKKVKTSHSEQGAPSPVQQLPKDHKAHELHLPKDEDNVLHLPEDFLLPDDEREYSHIKEKLFKSFEKQPTEYDAGYLASSILKKKTDGIASTTSSV